MYQVRDLQDAFNAIQDLMDRTNVDRAAFESDAEAAEKTVEVLRDQLREANEHIAELEQRGSVEARLEETALSALDKAIGTFDNPISDG